MNTTTDQPTLIENTHPSVNAPPRTVKLRQLRKHAAHDRTRYDLQKIAGLTLQIYQRDIDTWQPIVAASLPSDNGHDPAFAIISGHRRYFARIFVHAVREWAALEENQETVTDGITLDFVHALIQEMVTKLGSVEEAAAQLLQLYGEETLPIVRFQGDLKAQILALQAANFGSEEPDLLGRARSFKAAVDAGTTPQEIARNAGVNLHYVLNHLALANTHPELAQRIANDELSMSVARILAGLPEAQRQGLTSFILANPSAKLTVKQLKQTAKQLANWSGLQLPLTGYANQAQRNLARCLSQLWQNGVTNDAIAAWGATAVLAYQDTLQGEPWCQPERVKQWLQLFGGDQYVDANNKVQWQTVLKNLLPQLTCTACPISQLPKHTLNSDLGEGQGGALGMPCRLNMENESDPCIHGLVANDPFTVRVPWEWANHPGIQSQNGVYTANTLTDLQTAWQHQAQLETAEESQQEQVETPIPNADATAVTEETAPIKSGTISNPQSRIDQSPTVSSRPIPNTSAISAQVQPSPIQKMRTHIRTYMEEHGRFNTKHPFATPCNACRHKLDGSPTKDATLPHCTWAKRLRRVDFRQIIADENGLLPIPVCRQFAPSQIWTERIPAYPHPITMPRAWIARQILSLVKQGNGQAAHTNAIQRTMFAFLTGRPMSSSESSQDWFAEQFHQHQGSLSDAQLWTLFIWTLTELDRAQRKSFSLPVDAKSAQFVQANDVTW